MLAYLLQGSTLPVNLPDKQLLHSLPHKILPTGPSWLVLQLHQGVKLALGELLRVQQGLRCHRVMALQDIDVGLQSSSVSRSAWSARLQVMHHSLCAKCGESRQGEHQQLYRRPRAS